MALKVEYSFFKINMPVGRPSKNAGYGSISKTLVELRERERPNIITTWTILQTVTSTGAQIRNHG